MAKANRGVATIMGQHLWWALTRNGMKWSRLAWLQTKTSCYIMLDPHSSSLTEHLRLKHIEIFIFIALVACSHYHITWNKFTWWLTLFSMFSIVQCDFGFSVQVSVMQRLASPLLLNAYSLLASKSTRVKQLNAFRCSIFHLKLIEVGEAWPTSPTSGRCGLFLFFSHSCTAWVQSQEQSFKIAYENNQSHRQPEAPKASDTNLSSQQWSPWKGRTDQPGQ